MPFGRAPTQYARAQIVDTHDQTGALRVIAEFITKGALDPRVVEAAKAITNDCASRDDECELEAIFDAVKNGTDRIVGMENGFRYIADQRSHDAFWAAPRLLESCSRGACGGDCDDHTILIGALAAALGFRVGARAYAGPKSKDYEHVYCVVLVDKRGPWKRDRQGRFLEEHVRGMDTTVEEATMGWQPPAGNVLTSWIE